MEREISVILQIFTVVFISIAFAACHSLIFMEIPITDDCVDPLSSAQWRTLSVLSIKLHPQKVAS